MIKCEIAVFSYIKHSTTKDVSCRFADFSKFSVVAKLRRVIAVSGIIVCMCKSCGMGKGEMLNKVTLFVLHVKSTLEITLVT